MCDVMCSVPQVSVSGPLPFNIYICDLFFKEIETDFAYGTTPYVCDSKIEVVNKFSIGISVRYFNGLLITF